MQDTTLNKYRNQLRKMLDYKDTSIFFPEKAEVEKRAYLLRLELALSVIYSEIVETAECSGYYKCTANLKRELERINKSTKESFETI